MRLFQKSHFSFFSKIFPKKFLYFLNVSKGSPLNFFDILPQTGFSKSGKGPPSCFFFRQTTDLIVYVPLFTGFTRSRVLVSTVFVRFTVNPAVTASSPCFSQKLFRAIFRHCVTFFRFFLPSKGPTVKFFWIFCSKLRCQKAQRVSPFKYYFGSIRLFEILIFRFFRKLKKKFEIFWSPKGPPFNLFDILQQTGFSKSPKCPPFYRFKNCAF